MARHEDILYSLQLYCVTIQCNVRISYDINVRSTKHIFTTFLAEKFTIEKTALLFGTNWVRKRKKKHCNNTKPYQIMSHDDQEY